MQLHQIELVPGESIRVGNLIVTLVAVEIFAINRTQNIRWPVET